MDPLESWDAKLKEEMDRDALHFAASFGPIEKVSELLTRGFDVKRVDDLGLTALHYAVQHERLEIAQLLIDSGAIVDAMDENLAQTTPLCRSADRCSEKMIRLLIENGADPTIRIGLKKSALDKAKERKRGEGPAILKLFLEAIEGRGTLRKSKGKNKRSRG